MVTSCVNCQGTKFRRTTAEVKRHVADREFAGKLPAQECASCGMRYYAGPDLSRFELAVSIALANAGVTDAEALKFMRKVTGLNGKEFAELLEVRPETVSRWEKDKRPIDRATYAIIRQLLADRLHGTTEMADYLRSLRKPPRLPRTVKLHLDAA
jgi:putative zinc finger/helix-turn-helix YgiT family protein